MLVKDFGSAEDVSMDKFWRELIEACFDADINEGILQCAINKGKDNETTIKVKITIVELDGKVIEEEVA